MNPPKVLAETKAPTKRRISGVAAKLPAIQFIEAAMELEGLERERLLDLAEQEQRAGLEMARRADLTARRGQVLGLVSIVLVLALAGYMGSIGEAAWATVITAVDVVGVAGVFVTGQVVQRSGRTRA
ncbi:hypothetical protein [Streptomyces sp. NPDC047968]|uniref:hypothetical protein n=1 Tax=unclassified Streptomyces TaxID=2593676 RepID=UPI003442F44D